MPSESVAPPLTLYGVIQIHLTDALVKGHDFSGRQNKRRQHPLKMKVTYI